MQAVGRESLLSAVQQACDLRMGPEPVVVGLAGAQVGQQRAVQSRTAVAKEEVQAQAFEVNGSEIWK